jgi:hypothetical protein
VESAEKKLKIYSCFDVGLMDAEYCPSAINVSANTSFHLPINKGDG